MSKYDNGSVPQFSGCGVYQIQCRRTGYVYIGASVRVRTRMLSHIKELRLGRHKCVALQYAWSLLGEENFEFTVLEECHVDTVYDREGVFLRGSIFPLFSRTLQKFVASFDPARRKNLSRQAKRRHKLGKIHTPEVREASRERMKRLHQEGRIPTAPLHKAAKEQWNDPDYREMRSRVASQKWLDPVFREQKTEEAREQSKVRLRVNGRFAGK